MRRAWVFVLVLAACRDESRSVPVAAAEPAPVVEPVPTGTPYIPPQCYTKTEDAQGRVHNPCFTCHVDSAPPNYILDGALQAGYAFGPPALENRWTNLFVDRSAQVAAIPDADILAYVRQDNYAALAPRLATPGAWDADGDGRWSGWVPDLAFRFDDGGFDRATDGGYTGWRAYAYYPVPGTFWPTNGSFGDAMIRLPAAFREDPAGRFDRAVYAANLALVEAIIARRDVAIDATDERAVGADLDGDGRMGTAVVARFRWKPGGGGMTFAGRAAALQERGEVHLTAGLFPEGTELAHSVRYLDVDGDRVRMAARMKELRYMVKTAWVPYGTLERQAAKETTEKTERPTTRRAMVGDRERGMGNRAGWRLQAFIEDAGGALRPQSAVEHAYCIGCHSGVGATDDAVFSFGRKLAADRFQRGWYHWDQRGLEGEAEPVRADGRGEYTLYLEKNGAGDEFRANQEILSRFFDEGGALQADAVARMRSDVSILLLPSPARALELDKAYRVIVAEQSFTRGRDATIRPLDSVHRKLPEEERPTGVVDIVTSRRMPPQRGVTP